MKIAVYHELPKGGARMSVNQISKLLKKKNQVDLYTIRELADDEKDSYSATYKTPFKIRKWHGKDWRARFYKDTVELIRLFRTNMKVAETIRKRGYDLVFVHASEFIEAPFILRSKINNKFYYLHDPYYRYVYEPQFSQIGDVGVIRKFYEKINRKIRRYLDRKNVLQSDLVVANSDFSKKLFEKTYGKKATTARLGIDTHFFKPSAAKKTYDILFIGSKKFIDGYDTFIQIKNKLGGSILYRTVLIEDEFLSKSQIRDLYRKSKIVLCLSRMEPLGLIPLEGMACGAIVVAVNEGGHIETIIDGKSGFLVRRRADEIANVIRKILNNPQLTAKISRFAEKHVRENWSLAGTTHKLEQIFIEYL